MLIGNEENPIRNAHNQRTKNKDQKPKTWGCGQLIETSYDMMRYSG